VHGRWQPVVMLWALALSVNVSAQQSYTAPLHVPRGPVTFVPEDPALSSADSPGKHVIRSEDSFGDHMVSTYTRPLMHPAPAPQGRVSINDPLWGITAATIDRPVGWSFVGSVHRDNPCSPDDPEIAFRLKSPDGVVVEYMTPFFTSSVQHYGGGTHSVHCGVDAPGTLSAATILSHYILPSLYPGARILSPPEDTPGAAEWVKQSVGKLGTDSITAEAKRIRIGLLFHGRPGEAWIAVQTRFLHGSGYEASISIVTTVIAPAGHLDEAAKRANSFELQFDPEWSRRETERSAAVAAENKKRLNNTYVPAQNNLIGDHKSNPGQHPIDPGYHRGDYQSAPQSPRSSPQP
jgi:hypothetical protein